MPIIGMDQAGQAFQQGATIGAQAAQFAEATRRLQLAEQEFNSKQLQWKQNLDLEREKWGLEQQKAAAEMGLLRTQLQAAQFQLGQAQEQAGRQKSAIADFSTLSSKLADYSVARANQEYEKAGALAGEMVEIVGGKPHAGELFGLIKAAGSVFQLPTEVEGALVRSKAAAPADLLKAGARTTAADKVADSLQKEGLSGFSLQEAQANEAREVDSISKEAGLIIQYAQTFNQRANLGLSITATPEMMKNPTSLNAMLAQAAEAARQKGKLGAAEQKELDANLERVKGLVGRYEKMQATARVNSRYFQFTGELARHFVQPMYSTETDQGLVAAERYALQMGAGAMNVSRDFFQRFFELPVVQQYERETNPKIKAQLQETIRATTAKDAVLGQWPPELQAILLNQLTPNKFTDLGQNKVY